MHEIIDFNGPDTNAPEDRLSIAGIIQEAFWEKKRWFFAKVSKEEATGLMQKSITYRLGFYYKEEGVVLGCALLSKNGHPHFEATWPVRRQIGIVRSFLWQVFFAASPSDKDVLYLQMIATSPEARGKGVGKKMLAHLEVYAARQGFKSLMLDVIDTNLDAIRLYEKVGYKTTQKMKTGFLTRWMGIEGIHVMKKEI